MAKIITHHTISSGIVKDILAALAQGGMAGKYLGGGLSAQFFLPSDFHRVTADIDLETSERMTSGVFHDYVLNATKPLIERGYSIDFEKQRGTYDAILRRDNHCLVLQIPRRSNSKFTQEKFRLEREVDNAEIVPYAGGNLRLINVNDLIARKLRRINVFSTRYGLMVPEGMGIREEVERANHLKQNLDLSNLEPSEVAQKVAYIRMLSDVADVRAIFSSAKIDESYLRTAISECPIDNQKGITELSEKLAI